MAGTKKPAKAYVPLAKRKREVAFTEKNKMLDGSYVDHQAYCKTYRTQVTRVLRDLEKGETSSEDLARLRNFCQFALNAMERMPMADIDKAWRNAEAMSIIHHELDIPVVEDYRGVLDPAKQGE